MGQGCCGASLDVVPPTTPVAGNNGDLGQCAGTKCGDSAEAPAQSMDSPTKQVVGEEPNVEGLLGGSIGLDLLLQGMARALGVLPDLLATVIERVVDNLVCCSSLPTRLDGCFVVNIPLVVQFCQGYV